MSKKSSWHQNFKRSSKASRTTIDGIVFDSKSEMNRWFELKMLEKAGKVRNLERQVRYELVLPDGDPILTKTGRVAIYTPDFVYQENIGDEWVDIVEDHKGYTEDGSQLRISVFEAIFKKKVKIT